MTDIDRLLIGMALFVIGFLIHLFFRKNKYAEKEEYPWRLSKISGEDHFKTPENNLDEDLNLKYQEAMLLYDANNFKEAIIKLTDCISENNFSEFYYYRGICYFALKKYDESIVDWETAISLFPDYEYELRANINEAEKMKSTSSLFQ